MSIEKEDGSVANAHKIVGTITFALLLVQVRFSGWGFLGLRF